jgi:hypothetical protein
MFILYFLVKNLSSLENFEHLLKMLLLQENLGEKKCEFLMVKLLEN